MGVVDTQVVLVDKVVEVMKINVVKQTKVAAVVEVMVILVKKWVDQE